MARRDRDGYVALLAYLPHSAACEAWLASARDRVRRGTGAATVGGFGPRYLHSCGQLHKGGSPGGRFLFITADAPRVLEAPGYAASFGATQAAQALGDMEELMSRGRPCLRVHISGDLAAGLAQLDELLRQALTPVADPANPCVHLSPPRPTRGGSPLWSPAMKHTRILIATFVVNTLAGTACWPAQPPAGATNPPVTTAPGARPMPKAQPGQHESHPQPKAQPGQGAPRAVPKSDPPQGEPRPARKTAPPSVSTARAAPTAGARPAAGAAPARPARGHARFGRVRRLRRHHRDPLTRRLDAAQAASSRAGRRATCRMRSGSARAIPAACRSRITPR
ncbi:hypothetical protein WJ972_13585 [Achromobacter insuavis]